MIVISLLFFICLLSLYLIGACLFVYCLSNFSTICLSVICYLSTFCQLSLVWLSNVYLSNRCVMCVYLLYFWCMFACRQLNVYLLCIYIMYVSRILHMYVICLLSTVCCLPYVVFIYSPNCLFAVCVSLIITCCQCVCNFLPIFLVSVTCLHFVNCLSFYKFSVFSRFAFRLLYVCLIFSMYLKLHNKSTWPLEFNKSRI